MKKSFFVGPAILILVWLMVSWFNVIDSFFLPSLVEVFIALFLLFKSGAIIPDISSTFFKIIMSFSIAVVMGIPVGLLLGESKKTYDSMEFIIDFFRSTPITALFPLFLLVFGIGDWSKIILAAFSGFLFIVFNTAYGVINAKKSRVLAARTMGASKLQIFKHIIFWESLPQTFVGLRNAVSLSFVVIIITEMFIGTSFGLGHRILNSQMIYDVSGMYATIIVTGMLGYALNLCISLIERKYVHWGGK